MIDIEILALIFAVLIILKILVFMINPKCLKKLAGSMSKKPILLTSIYLILAVIVGYYVFEFFNIIGVAAVMLFASLLINLNFLSLPKAYPEILKEIPETRFGVIRKFWLSIVIWSGLAIWVLMSLFGK